MPARSRIVIVERVAGAVPVSLPSRATPGSACFDLCAAESLDLTRNAVTLVRTGFRMRAPPGMFLEVRPRSGLSAKGVCIVNSPGTIDRDYSGEVKVPMTYLFEGSYRVQAGDRIGQLRLVEEWPTEIHFGKVRAARSRAGGFGSTGR
jgi:dUTP pyrophosphatase